MARLIAIAFARSTIECDDRAADKIAAVKRFLASAAQRDFEEIVFVAARELPVYEAFDQTLDRRRQGHRLPWQARRRKEDRP